jgi:hypothetical protein
MHCVAQPSHLSVLLVEDLPSLWTARGLEHDIVAEGRTSEKAIRGILGFVAAHIDFDRRHNRPPLSAFPPAPKRFWTTFERATPLERVQCDGTPHGAAEQIQIQISIARERPLAQAARKIAPGWPCRRPESVSRAARLEQ